MLRRGANRGAPLGTRAPQPGTPGELQQAYDLSYLSRTRGANATIAIVQAYDAPRAEADLAVYRSAFGLPPCTTANGCFRKVDQNGGTNFPTANAGWAMDISSDLDAVSALCPRCRLRVVEAKSSALTDLAIAQGEAVRLGATHITDSWGVDGWQGPTPDVVANQFTFPGVTTVAASGDNGYTGRLTFPALLPNATAAGGTRLLPASATGIQTPRGFTESAWSGSGSGCDLSAGKPVWQANVGCAGRAYSDVSVSADPSHPLQVYDSLAGGWIAAGGTSVAAPLIAAYDAITNAPAATPAWAYQAASLLNHPFGGNTGACARAISYICSGGIGYHGPTGVGSISGAVVPGAPGIGGAGVNGSYTRRTTASSANLQGGVYPNSSATAYWWEYGRTTAYGHQTRPRSIGAGAAVVGVSGSIGGLRPSTTYHYRLVARNGFGVMYGYDFTLRTR